MRAIAGEQQIALATEIAGDITAAGTALGGLLLVFVGFITTSFESYGAEAKSAVIGTYRWRGWLAVVGFIFALSSAAFAIAGKWSESSCLVGVSAALLGISFVIVVVVAFVTMSSIR